MLRHSIVAIIRYNLLCNVWGQIRNR